MHLLVLSAFRPQGIQSITALPFVSMHLLALSAFRLVVGKLAQHTGSGLNEPFGAQCFPTGLRSHGSRCRPVSQCTFWCSVLSDARYLQPVPVCSAVSMHLLVLSAFRLGGGLELRRRLRSQCTFWCSVLSDLSVASMAVSTIPRLNAPFGAQCFPTGSPGG